MAQLNKRLQNSATIKKIDVIQNENLREENLSRKKLHLNKQGNSLLANNFVKFIKDF